MTLDWRLAEEISSISRGGTTTETAPVVTRELEIQDERKVDQDIATISDGVAKTPEGRATGELAAG